MLVAIGILYSELDASEDFYERGAGRPENPIEGPNMYTKGGTTKDVKILPKYIKFPFLLDIS